MKLPDKPHSADVLGDWRDEWWSRDFLGLLGQRFGWGQLTSVADVGCGKGHWGRALLPFVHPDAELIGVDRESDWVAEAEAQAEALGCRARYVVADAESLPLADGTTDLVTCQTLLMHVAKPPKVLAEMARVVRPGGLVVASEPSNLATCLLRDSVTIQYDARRLARVAEFHACIALGRAALGEGDECIADRLPHLMSVAGLELVEVVQNERTRPMLPPYSDEMLRSLGPFPDLVRDRRWLFDRQYARRLYAAGGGDEARFETLHGEHIEQAEEGLAQIDAGTFWSSGAHNHVLVVARRPGA